jgi:nicotinate-nucleotide adenylyltransferase
METIALFGGSFDPPHIGHLAIIEALKKLEQIDKIIIMPTFLNPFKAKSHASSALRLQWLHEIFSDEKQVIISDYEVTQGKKTPTIESVNYLLKSYNKIYLVIGADNLASLHRWERYEELCTKVTFIVATRDKIEIPENFLSLDVQEEISSSQLRDTMDITKLIPKCAQTIADFYKENNAK